MAHLFLDLDGHPVGEAVEALVAEPRLHGVVDIGAVELVVELIVDGVLYARVDHVRWPFLAAVFPATIPRPTRKGPPGGGPLACASCFPADPYEVAVPPIISGTSCSRIVSIWVSRAAASVFGRVVGSLVLVLQRLDGLTGDVDRALDALHQGVLEGGESARELQVLQTVQRGLHLLQRRFIGLDVGIGDFGDVGDIHGVGPLRKGVEAAEQGLHLAEVGRQFRRHGRHGAGAGGGGGGCRSGRSGGRGRGGRGLVRRAAGRGREGEDNQ